MTHYYSPSSLSEALHWRYATKVFNPDKKISDETWEALKSSLQLAPSSFGLQPWKFIEVVSPDLRKKIQAAAWNQSQVVDAPKLLVLTARRNVGEREVARLISTLAQERGIEVGSLAGYQGMMNGFIANPPSPMSQEEWSTRQVYLALGVLLTSAAFLRVDACPMEGFMPSEVDSTLGLVGSEYSSKVLCPLGYRGDSDAYAMQKKVRYSMEQIFESR